MDRPAMSGRNKYARATHRMACNPKRTQSDRIEEWSKKTAKAFDWKMLQGIIRFNSGGGNDRSPIIQGR